MRPILLLLSLCLLLDGRAHAESSLVKPNDPYFAPFSPVPGPHRHGLILRRGDRLAICGDSITEQKRYSRIMEDYLTMCVPQMEITTRQFGWGGEKAPGFLARMTNDCLRFHPTIATTCYGMNDFAYRKFDPQLAEIYQASQTAIVESFKKNGVRVVLGSAGSVGRIPPWGNPQNGSLQDLNLSLCQFRNLDVRIAKKEGVAFADVFWPMLEGGYEARKTYGDEYALNGRDGVHPGWAGHTVMAHAFLIAMGLDGNIGVFRVNLRKHVMKVSEGHRVTGAQGNRFEIESTRYPFCPCTPPPTASGYPACGQDPLSSDQSIRSGMEWVPFNQDLNRLMLVAKNGSAGRYMVKWGAEQKEFSAAELAAGVNLAAVFDHNPFSEAFARVDAAVAAKQEFETDEIKNQFEDQHEHLSREAIYERTEAAVQEAEKEHERLAEAVHAAFVPVDHVLEIDPL